MLKAVIFDFDYTLGDSTKGIVLCMNHAFAQMGYPSQEVEPIKKTVGRRLQDAFHILTGNEDEDKAEEFTILFKEKANEVMTAASELYPGVEEMLDKLQKAGLKTAVVTTKMRFRVEDILKKYDASALIDKIVGSDDVKIEKPNPEGLLWTMDYFGLDKSEVLYVGDSFIDAKTAENAGVNFAAVLTGTTTKEEFDNYKYVFLGKNVLDVYAYVMER